MISAAEAWGLIAQRARALPVERRGLAQAAGRVLAQRIAAPIDLPPFDRAAMDGYAVRAGDIAEGARLRFVGDRPAGADPGPSVGPGEAAGISTGAPVPVGADTVVALERTGRDGDVVILNEVTAPGANIRRRGEDIAAGAQMLGAGTRLAPRHLGLLAAGGIHEAAVHRAPRVAVLATGSELVAPGGERPPAAIYESNRVVLDALAAHAGAEVTDLGTVPDDPAAIAEAIAGGLRSDLLLVSGGVSVGAHDHVGPALERCGVQTVFRRVAIRPGGPTVCASHDAGWVLGLPGNPLACVVGFLVFGAPLLRVLDGEPAAPAPTRRARLATTVAPAPGRTTYLTARLRSGADGWPEAKPLAVQGSAMTKALADADALIVLEPRRGEIRAGSEVDVLEF